MTLFMGLIKFPDFSLIWGIFIKFPDFSLTGKSGTHFPGFPGRVGTLYNDTFHEMEREGIIIEVPDEQIVLNWESCLLHASSPSY